MKKIAITLIMFISAAIFYSSPSLAQWATNGNHIYNTNTGNVAIGLNSPGYLLHVGKSMTEPAITVQNTGGTGGATYNMIDDASGANWKFKATLSGGFKIRDHANGLDVVVIEPNSEANSIYINSSGNVGIGTPTPSSKLHILGGTLRTSLPLNGQGILLSFCDKSGTQGDTYHIFADFSGANQDGNWITMADEWGNNIQTWRNASVGFGTTDPDQSALVDMSSTNKGFLMPRMTTTQRDAISSPDEGLLIFNLTTGCIDYYLGGSWKSFCGSTEPEFQCGMKLSDTRDGKMYNTVKIGDQCWMAQNLNTGTRINGVVNMQDNDILEKYCYNDQDANCDIYGGMYQWNEMMEYSTTPGVQGICPDGWHLPTYDEYVQLSAFLGGDAVAGGKMKEVGFTHWNTPNTNATNASGFTGLPGGDRFHNTGNFVNLGLNGFFWTSTQQNESAGHVRYLLYDSGVLSPQGDWKNHGYSVRCIQN